MSSALAYAFDAPPQIGKPFLVAPGVFWLRMPLPFQLDHINLWLLEDHDGWTLIDTGLNNQATRDIWQRIYTEELGGKPIVRVMATHFHPDHMGLAGMHCDHWGVSLWASLTGWLYSRTLCLDESEAMLEAHTRFYSRMGFDEDQMRTVRGRSMSYQERAGVPPAAVRRIRAGDEIDIGGRKWRTVLGEGHAPEHMSFFCEETGVLISGDQILPRISPAVGVWPQEPDADPLRLFLASLDNFRSLPENTLVLPSHGLPFRGLHYRLDQLARHHDLRLEDTLKACAQPTSSVELLQVLFRRPLDLHQMYFAVGESLAHLHYLMGQGKVSRATDPKGVDRFQAI